MRRSIDHAAMPVCGFVSPWSVRAGEECALRLSGVEPRPTVRLVRLDRPDQATADGRVESSTEAVPLGEIDLGSFLSLPLPRGARSGWAIELELKLTRNPEPRPVVDVGGAIFEAGAGDAGFAGGERRPVRAGVWLALRIAASPGGLEAEILDAGRTTRWRRERAAAADAILIGGDARRARPTLNAQVGRIRLSAGGRVWRWRFPAVGLARRLPPMEGEGPALEIRNLPTPSTPSPRWTGEAFDPRLVPDHYDALRLHDDDFGGLELPVTHRISIGADAEPGVYAAEVATRRGVERLPFFVRPRVPRARRVFLAPTATYLAYADEALPPERFPWVCDDRGHRFARANGLTSAYDVHSDGSGVSLTTLSRPFATLRDDYRYPLCGAPHLLPVDLRLLRFCAAEGVPLDLLTDHDLDRDGAAALSGHAGVITGSHPEYWSIPMLNALEAFLGAGGSLAYLGGNGFDTAVAFDADAMELRRVGIPSHRTWDMGLGETNLALTGEPAGPLRQRGRGEFALTGVGMSLMGFGPSRPYHRRSFAPEHDWIFKGVVAESFGHEGEVLGGAAGYEVDAADRRLGTPEDVAVLAEADGFDESFVDDAARWFEGGETERAARRKAEMTIRPHPGGGFVFSAGSVAWCGALPDPGEINDVGRITLNVLRRLAAA